MNLFTLAFRNIRQNNKKYAMYFFSMGFSVFTVYTFSSLMNNEYVMKAFRYDQRYQSLLTAFGVIILVFVLFFLISSNSSFIRARKKEVSTYSLFGMTNGRIGRLLFLETMIVGTATLVIGILAGIFFSKLMAMFLLNLSLTNFVGDVSFVIDPKSVIITAVLFLGIFIFMGLTGLRVICKFELVDLFKADKISEGRYKGSRVVLVLSLLLIFSGYFIACSKNATVVVLGAIPILTLVITGTYFFFWGGLPKVLNLIKKNKRTYYQGVNLISTSAFSHRMKSLASVMATIAVLSAVAVTAIATGFTLYSNAEKNSYSSVGFDLYYYVGQKDMTDKVHQAFQNHHGVIENEYTLQLYEATPDFHGETLLGQENLTPEERYFRIYSETDYNKMISYSKTNLESVRIAPGEGLYIYPYSMEDIKSTILGKSLDFRSKEIRVTDVIRSAVPNFGSFNTIVIDDSDFQSMKDNGMIKTAAESGKEYHAVTVMNYKNALKSKELYQVVDEVFKNEKQQYRTVYYIYNESMETFGLICFIGFFMSVVFILMTASLLYFKQVMAAEEERHQFRMLRKIGMDVNMERKVIRKRLLPVFFIPLVIGIVHSIFAMKTADTIVFSNLIPVENSYLTVLGFSGIMYGAYAFVYVIFYLVTKNQYTRIVIK